MKDRQKLGAYDYTASCSLNEYNPKKPFYYDIFKWLPKKGGGIKPSEVVYRVKGSIVNIDKMLSAVEYVCDRLDEGWVPK